MSFVVLLDNSCLVNVLENVDIAHFISIFCQRITVINITFCYTAGKLESGKIIVSQGKSCVNHKPVVGLSKSTCFNSDYTGLTEFVNFHQRKETLLILMKYEVHDFEITVIYQNPYTQSVNYDFNN